MTAHTHPEGTHSDPESTGRALAERLRERGMRMTPQRDRVMAAVTELVHATPEEVARAIPDVDLTTVYRTLETLAEIGLVTHTHLGHGAPSYRLASDAHVHLVCHRCGVVDDAPEDLLSGLSAQLQQERGFIVDRSHFSVFGTCADCSVAV